MARVLGQLFEITEIFDMRMQPQLIMLQKTMMQAEGVARRLHPEFDMWAASRPIVEASLRRELGIEGRVSDMLADLRKAHKTLRTMPEAAENIAALAKAWADGKIDLSQRTITQPTKQGFGAFGFGAIWAMAGVITALAGVWAIGQL